MRVLLNLRSLKNCSYKLEPGKLQGLIYNLLKDSGYSGLHDKPGYKFFCFSNIFPIGDFKEGDSRNLLISSPDPYFVRILESALTTKTSLNIGELQFNITSIKTLKPRIGNNSKIISATPIVIRIPEKNYGKYGIPEEKRKKSYLFWRPEYPFEAFVRQMEDNLFKKYNQFYSKQIQPFPLFEQFRFKKSVASSIIKDGREHVEIGSIWEFEFSHLSREQREILEFGIDCGFGERNSYGFGFVNLV